MWTHPNDNDWRIHSSKLIWVNLALSACCYQSFDYLQQLTENSVVTLSILSVNGVSGPGRFSIDNQGIITVEDTLMGTTINEYQVRHTAVWCLLLTHILSYCVLGNLCCICPSHTTINSLTNRHEFIIFRIRGISWTFLVYLKLLTNQ